MATNPNNAVGTNAAYDGRTSVEAFNDDLAAFTSGIISGWDCSPNTGMTVSLGGDGSTRDVAIAEDNAGNKTTINNISGSPIDVTLSAAPGSNSRIDLVVAYVDNPPQGSNTETDNPDACGIIKVTGIAASTPAEPDDSDIRSAITADGASGTTAFYVVLAKITVASGVATITSSDIEQGGIAALRGEKVVSSDNINWSSLPAVPKCVISAHLSSNIAINSGTVIAMAQENIIGEGLTINGSGRFVIGDNINYVLVFASWTCSPEASGFRRVHIRKNGSLTEGYAFTTSDVATGYLNGAVGGILLSVTKGDIIALYNRDTRMTFWTGTRTSLIAF